MSYHLNIHWEGHDLEGLDLQLLAYNHRELGERLQAQARPHGFRFEGLQSGSYLLCLRYVLAGRHFDSFYFQLDLPDITQIKLQGREHGAQIEQMGFLNDYGEFVDMLIYEEQKPYLTRPSEDYPLLQVLSEFLVFRFSALSSSEKRQQLDQILGPLDQCFRELEQLWPYQLRMLLDPAVLAHTSAGWKACLSHLLRNDLMLMDNEALHEQIQEAMQLSQQQDRVHELLEDLEWNPENGQWQHLEQFLQELHTYRLLGTR